MANSRMTIEIPEELVDSLSRQVPEEEQSQFIVDSLRRGLGSFISDEEWREQEEMLIAACDLANNDPETQEIEREMAALPDTMTEEWNDFVELPKAG